MEQRLKDRLETLRSELDRGNKRIENRETMRLTLAQLDAQAPELKERLLRIAGAIQAIEEILGMREAVE